MELTVNQIINILEVCSRCECEESCPLYNMPHCKNYLQKECLRLLSYYQKLDTETDELFRRISRSVRIDNLSDKDVFLKYIDDVRYNTIRDTIKEYNSRLSPTVEQLLKEHSDRVCEEINKGMTTEFKSILDDISNLSENIIKDIFSNRDNGDNNGNQ